MSDNLPAVKDTVSVLLNPHQFKSEIYVCEVKSGVTINEIFGNNFFPGVKVEVNGIEISKECWNITYIFSSDHVLVSVVPMGEGDDVWRMVASVAATIVITGVTRGAGFTGMAGTIISTGLTMAAQYGIRKLIPPQQPDKSDKSTPSGQRREAITGARNQPNRYGPVPKIYGFNRYYPPLAANYYTSVKDNEQFLHMLVMLGYKDDLVVFGPYDDRYNNKAWYRPYTDSDGNVKNSHYTMRIGDTDILQFRNLDFEVGTASEITLYEKVVEEQNPGASLSLQQYSTQKGYEVGDVVSAFYEPESYQEYGDITQSFYPGEYCFVTEYDGANPGKLHYYQCLKYDPQSECNHPAAEYEQDDGSCYFTSDSFNVDNEYWEYRGHLAPDSGWDESEVSTTTVFECIKRVPPANEREYDDDHYNPTKDGLDEYWDKSDTRPQATRSIQEQELGSISFDITFPNGLYGMDKNGNLCECTAKFTYEIKDINDPEDDEYWTTLASSLDGDPEAIITGGSRSTIRRTIEIKHWFGDIDFGVYAHHGWTLRITRDDTIVDKRTMVGYEAKLSAIRAFAPSENIINDPYENFLLLALRVQGSNQLNGVIDDLNLYARSRLPVYDESSGSWSRQETNNPVWAFCDVLKGVQVDNPIIDERLQLEGSNNIIEAAEWCVNRGKDVKLWTTYVTYNVLDTVLYGDEYYTCIKYHTYSSIPPPENPSRWQRGITLGFDHVFDGDDTIAERLQQISSTARTQWTIQDGRFALIRDKENDLPAQTITPRNSWNFSAEKSIVEIPGRLKVKFTDPETLDQDQKVIHTDSTSTKVDEITTVGVTNSGQAELEGWYHLASTEYRPEIFTVEMDFENLKCRRGDSVILAHDAMLVGIDANSKISRIIDDYTLEIDQEIIFPHPEYEDKDHVIRISFPDEDVNGIACMNSSIHTIKSVSEGYRIHLDESDNSIGSSLIAEGNSVIYGIKEKESIQAKVTSIDYNADLSATLTLTHDNTSDILKAVDDKELGDFDPNITEPIDPYLIAPKTPVIDSVSAFKYRSTKFVNISFVTFGSRVPVDIVELNWKISGTSNWNTLTDRAENSSIRIESGLPNDGTDIELRVRSRSALSGKWSAWSDVDTFTLNYDNVSNPGKPTSINAYTIKSGIMLEWGVPLNYSNPEYHIKRGDSTDSFEEAISLGKTNNNSFIDDYLPEGDYQYWVYVVDPEQTNVPIRSTVTVNGPNKPDVSYKVTKNQINLDWASCKTDFPIQYYEIWHEAPAFELDTEYNVNDVVEYDGVYYRAINYISLSSETPDTSSDWTTPPWVKTDTQFTRDIFFTGTLEFYVKAIDVAGNESSYDIIPVSVEGVPAVADITTVSAPYAIIVKVSADISNPDGIDAVELHAAAIQDRSNAEKIHEWNPNNELNFNHTSSDFDPGDTWYYWARIRDIHGNHGDWYPSLSTDGVPGEVSGDPSDYINLLDSVISDSAIATALNFSSIEDFFKWEGTGRYTIGKDNVTYSGLANAVQNGLGAIEERMAVYDTENAPDHDSTNSYNRGQIVDDGNGNYYRAIQDVPSGISLSNDSYWSQMNAGILSMYSLRLGAGNEVVGFGMSTTSEGNSTFLINADHFGIYDSSADISNDPQSGDNPIFSAGSVNGNNIVGINGDLMIDGTVHLHALSFTPLESVGNPDEVVGTINASDEGIRISGDKIELNGNTTVYGSFTVTASDNIPDVESGADITAENSQYWDWIDGEKPEQYADKTSDHALDIQHTGNYPPDYPNEGWLWHDTSVTPNELKRYTSGSWNKIATLEASWSQIVDDNGGKPKDGADKTQTKIDGGVITTGYIKDNDNNLLINFGDSRIDVNNDNGLRINSPDGLKIKDGGGLSVEKGGDFTIYNDNSNLNIYSGGSGHIAYIEQTNAAGDIVMGCERLYLHNETLDFQASNNTRFYIDAGGGIGNYLLASTIYNSSGSYRTDFVQDNDHFRFSCPFEYSGSMYSGNNVNYWCTKITNLADGNTVNLGPYLKHYNGSVELLARKNGEPSTARMESWYVDKRPGEWETKAHTGPGLGDINIKHNDYGHYFQNDSGDYIDVVIRMWYM